MKKRLLISIFALTATLSCVCGLSACNKDNKQATESEQTQATESLRYQKIAGKDEYRVIGLGTISDLDIVIPSTYRGLPVTEIGYGALSAQNDTGMIYLTSITIPDGVTSIGERAFYNCSSLTSIQYRGTQEQWSAIDKGVEWDNFTGDYTITYNYTGE